MQHLLHVLALLISVLLLGCRDNLVIKTFGRSAPDSSVYTPGAAVDFAVGTAEGEETYPLLLIESAKVCSDITYYNGDGQLVQGTRRCRAPDPMLKAEHIVAGVRVADVLGRAQLLREISPADVRLGVNLGGIIGTMEPSPPSCAADGAVGCVTREPFRAAETANLAGKLLSAYTVAGVPGTVQSESHSECTEAQQEGCIATANYKTMDLSFASTSMADLSAAAFQTALASSGSFEFWDSNGIRHVMSGDSDLTPANIVSGVLIFGVTGSASLESHSDCTGAMQSACVASSLFKTMDLSAADATPDLTAANLSTSLASASNFEFWDSSGMRHVMNGDSDLSSAFIKSGTVIHGVSGMASIEAHADCTGSNQSGCVATSSYRTMDLSAAGADVGLSSSNFNATLASAANFEFWDSAGNRHSVAGDSDLLPQNILSTQTVFGIAGSLSARPLDCSGNGTQNCVATGSYFAATSCGANGSGCYIPNYVASTQPLKAISYDAIESGKGLMRSSLSLAGISGNLVDCNSNGALACVSTASYQAADLSNLAAAHVKRGVSIGGTSGNFPSATSPLPNFVDSGATSSTSGSDLNDLTNLASQLVGSGSFEFWDSSGVRRAGSGDTDLTAANLMYGVALENISLTGSYTGSALCASDGQVGCAITGSFRSLDALNLSVWDFRRGKTLGGIAGSISFFKNMADLASYNRTSGAGAQAGLDIYDTIHDYQYVSPYAFTTSTPAGWDQATGVNWTMIAANQVYLDRFTGLYWTNDLGWDELEPSITVCESLSNYGGRSDWRLPTKKELLQAHINGIWSLEPVMSFSWSYYWAATTSFEYAYEGATMMWLYNGENYLDTKDDSAGIICVAP